MTHTLIQALEHWGRPRILIVGDLILDRYIWGDAERISQEAPVILLRAERREERLGGAASVASMVAALEGEVTLAGVLGEDEAGQRCRELLDERGILHDLVLADPSRPTTLKERYMGKAQHRHPQQMMRVDYEVRTPISDDLVSRLAAAVESQLVDFDIILVSDYDKGVCAPSLLRRLIEAARDQKCRVIVDPIRGGDYSIRYRGASTMTPNRLEAGLATGQEILDVAMGLRAAERLRQDLDLEAGIVTLDRDGMVLSDAAGASHHFPVREREVYDITGAGDMVLAVLGMALASGADYPEAIQLANTAGGLEVERLGVATLSRDDLLRDLLAEPGRARAKVLPLLELSDRLERQRRLGKRLVVAHGRFDTLNADVVDRLEDARSSGDILVAVIDDDDLHSDGGEEKSERARVLAALECVDYVCRAGDALSPLLSRLDPEVVLAIASLERELA